VTDSEPRGFTTPTLVVTGGPLDGREFPLPMTLREVVLGSGGQADVQIGLGNVDPVHAKVVFGPNGLAIMDGGSSTGTFLNGERVDGEWPLQEGDRVCLGPPGAKGSAKLLVLLPHRPAKGAPAAGATAAPGGSPFAEDEPAPIVLEADAHPAVTLDSDAPWPPPEPEAPIEAPPARAHEAPLVAEDVVVDGAGAGPPLDAKELPAPPGAGASPFDAPLPPPISPRPPTPSATTVVPPPPAPAPSAAPAPPPRSTEAPLTAPPPEDSPTAFPALLHDEEPPPPPASPRSARVASRGRRPIPRRGRRSSLPVVPALGGLAVLLVFLSAAGWWFFLRPSPPATRGGAPPPASAADTGPANAAGRKAAPPAATGLQPDVALPGETVLVRAANLSAPVAVTIGGVTAEVRETTAEGVRVVVPALPLGPGQTADVLVKSGSVTLNPGQLTVGRLPMVLEVAPERGPVGQSVVVKGRGFADDPRQNTVTFGGAPALVLAATPTELTAVVPAPTMTESPDLPVIVTTGGRASARSVTYALQRPATSTFVPRFFGAPVTERPGEDLAFVSTELAPVLLLGGRGQSASTAVRASEVATVLDRLVARAASRRVDIELRERPAPSVAVVGDPSPFLVPFPEDAAAYANPRESAARRGPRVSTPQLARYWAALLKDYFGLFLYRERPLEVAALSPRGRVFMDIYAEALRRAGSTGVPTSVVYPPSEAMAASLRQVALVPSTGSPHEEIAVEGRWRGTMEDPELGSRRFEVRFRPRAAGLAGTITTWRGSLELSSPLRDIRFERGTLRFTADIQGAPQKFEGTLHNTTISGTAERPGSAVPFSLEFVD
jgi:FHA domain/IPT/TIG domain